jgi:hypothetical protein
LLACAACSPCLHLHNGPLTPGHACPSTPGTHAGLQVCQSDKPPTHVRSPSEWFVLSWVLRRAGRRSAARSVAGDCRGDFETPPVCRLHGSGQRATGRRSAHLVCHKWGRSLGQRDLYVYAGSAGAPGCITVSSPLSLFPISPPSRFGRGFQWLSRRKGRSSLIIAKRTYRDSCESLLGTPARTCGHEREEP